MTDRVAIRSGRRASAVASLWRFRGYGRPHIPALLAGIGCRVVELAADVAQPWPLAIVVDQVLGRSHRPLRGAARLIFGPFAATPIGLLTAVAVASGLFIAISGAFDYLGDSVMNGAGEKMTTAIRQALYAHLHRLPLSWHDSQSVGEVVSRVSVDTDRIEDALVAVFSTLIPGVITVIGFGAVLILLQWRLALVALAAVPLVFLAASRVGRANREAAADRRRAEGRLAAVATETLQGIRTVRSHGRHQLHDDHFAALNNEAMGYGLRAVRLRARLTPLLEGAAGVGSTGVLWVGGYGVLRGWWTLGLLIVVLAYVRNLVKPLRALSGMSLTLARAAASADRVSDAFAVSDQPTRPRIHPNRAARGRVEFDHVTVDYGRGPVLDGINLLVEPGERVAILGPNGAGKSTLLALAAGLYEPTRGQVRLDGQKLSSLDRSWLVTQVAVVPQETFLFAGTVWDNIAYGRPDATRAEILSAARAALVDEFVSPLPRGYDTEIGDRGVGVSGGQRQRIAIARALLLDAPIVLLDEPTSGLDVEAEKSVVHALKALVAGRTVLMTTHRSALLALAHRHVELVGGKAHAARSAWPQADQRKRQEQRVGSH